jgi:L-ascorbate metabolism protein UlaG (beta-lactamase superfamily)
MKNLLWLAVLISVSAGAEINVQYIANAGVLVTDGESKVLFDPLFDTDYGQYYLPPAEIRKAILDGVAPFDNVDAVFISHVHADHFVSGDVLTLLRQQQGIKLYGSPQVVKALRDAANGSYTEVFDRVIEIQADAGDAPASREQDSLSIAAVRIPHSGWPDSRQDIQNIAFLVSFAGGGSVLHMGDADVRDEHFAAYSEHWDNQQTTLALPPYWYFLSDAGRTIIKTRIRSDMAIGVHVPKSVAEDPARRRAGLRDVVLFTRPGEVRKLASP